MDREGQEGQNNAVPLFGKIMMVKPAHGLEEAVVAGVEEMVELEEVLSTLVPQQLLIIQQSLHQELMLLRADRGGEEAQEVDGAVVLVPLIHVEEMGGMVVLVEEVEREEVYISSPRR